ncbi:response regulator transcription factor [Catellatospora citrea]|uniref:Response regulator MprA n=1 Tax=Catellatospora citrea TaxID=53366 RepID=A0A8J3K913_9ACTN|nr:response regulator transcription factor [Catellatospora citrea]RKE12151.1 winged helix family two component transcriptional regulator [Catellatospora citrea]GIF98886.1 response regulator MprA [Catellatospora citrea]
MRILVAEDDTAVRDSLARSLRFEGYAVDVAQDGAQALACVLAAEPDALVLDVMMPEVDGLDVCRTLRQQGIVVPVLMLTARDSVGDRVAGLDAGADDYLVKPFALQELLARLRALLRRAVLTGVPGNDGPLRFAGIILDPVTREVTADGRAVRLTRTEFSILEVFLRHPRQVLSRSTLFEHVWGCDLGESSNSLHVYVGYLRRKLETAGQNRLLHTVRGVGYVLRETPL